jgi:hypothetical protein
MPMLPLVGVQHGSSIDSNYKVADAQVYGEISNRPEGI